MVFLIICFFVVILIAAGSGNNGNAKTKIQEIEREYERIADLRKKTAAEEARINSKIEREKEREREATTHLKEKYEQIEDLRKKTAADEARAKTRIEKEMELIAHQREEMVEEEERIENKRKNMLDNIMNELDKNLADREKAYRWLAPMVADIKIAIQEMNRPFTEQVKYRSMDSMVKVSILKAEKEKVLEENLVLKYQMAYIRSAVPSVDDIIEYDEEQSTNERVQDDPWVFLAKDEYAMLSDTEKDKRALEYYKKRKKKKWEIGRDFEQCIGYECEKLGYAVQYYGIEKKYEDLGRDLIIENNRVIRIIQCKYWSKNKTIHEKHIMQLYGTLVKYKIDNPHVNKPVDAVFITHTTLSDTAKEFAIALNIDFIENVELREYPIIKCNVNRIGDGKITRIYHLPMDLQYDKIKMNKKEGDFYAWTIEEAERNGFRRAYRWHGSNSPVIR
jgi:hypothetical protein